MIQTLLLTAAALALVVPLALAGLEWRDHRHLQSNPQRCGRCRHLKNCRLLGNVGEQQWQCRSCQLVPPMCCGVLLFTLILAAALAAVRWL